MGGNEAEGREKKDEGRKTKSRSLELNTKEIVMFKKNHVFLKFFRCFFCFSYFFHPLSSIFDFRSFVFSLLSLFCLISPIFSYADPQIGLPLNKYAPGVYDIQSFALPQEAHEITIIAKRNGWSDTGGDVISVRIDISNDNGRTWDFLCGFKTSGGEIKDRKTGEIKEKSLLRFVLPETQGTGRMIRGSVEMFTALETEVSIDLK